MINKLIITCILILGISTISNAQYSFHAHEIYVDIFAPIGFKTVMATYELSLTDTYSVGVQGLKNLSKDNENYNDAYEDFSLTPFFRSYFQDDEADGFFYEGFVKYEERRIKANVYHSFIGPGIGAGLKKVSSFGLVYGINFGIGYAFSTTTGIENDFLKRGSLFIGWRF